MLLYKAIGATIVTLSASAIGADRAKMYTKRVKNLDALKKCVEFIENEISFSSPTICDAMYSVSVLEESVICKIFADASMELNNKYGKTFEDVWRESVRKYSDRLFDKDIPLILSFADCVNKGNVEVQTKTLKEYIKRIKTVIEDIRPSCNKNAHLSRSFGLYAGMLISVLLF